MSNTSFENASERMTPPANDGAVPGETPGTAAGASSRLRDAAASVANAISDGDVNAGLHRAKDLASTAAHSVSNAAAYVGEKADSATRSVGSTMEATGHHLKEDGLRTITTDLTEVIRRHPIPALLIGAGLGYLFARSSAVRHG